MTIKILAGIAAVAAMMASPAMAEGRYIKRHSADVGGVTTVKKADRLRGSYAYYDDGQRFYPRRVVAYDNWNRTGFWPADVATGVVGGAVATAGTIATAPFSPFLNDSYAYYGDGYYDRPIHHRSFARWGGPYYDGSYAYAPW